MTVGTIACTGVRGPAILGQEQESAMSSEEPPPVDEKLDISLTVRLTKSLQQRLVRLAKADKRSPGMMARILIEEGIERRQDAS